MDSKRKYDYYNMLYKANVITKSIWLIANIMASFVDTFRQTLKEPKSLWAAQKGRQLFDTQTSWWERLLDEIK